MPTGPAVSAGQAGPSRQVAPLGQAPAPPTSVAQLLPSVSPPDSTDPSGLAHEPLVPPSPMARPSPSGSGARAAPGGTANPYGYAATRKRASWSWLIRVAALALVGVLLWAGLVLGPGLAKRAEQAEEDFGTELKTVEEIRRTNPDAFADSAGGAPSGRAVPAAPTGTSRAEDEPEEDERSASPRQQMEEWHEKHYMERMVPLAASLEAVDFGGLDPALCEALRDDLRAAERDIPVAPHSEIENTFRPGLVAFAQARQACFTRDEQQWAFHLLQGKRATHRAQEMMMDRYQLPGVLELELESEVGIERSLESISGRFLDESKDFG